MSETTDQDAWVHRVLQVSVSSSSGTSKPEPFQVFVKSVDNVTLTLTLPEGPNTLLGALRTLIEDRTGLTPEEAALTIGTKPYNPSHAKLAVSEYGLQKNQTLFLNGTLKGGFGERAAVADIILRDIQHGNVLGDIEVTGGESRAKKSLGRKMLDSKNPLNDQLCTTLFKKLNSNGTLPEGVNSKSDLSKWLQTNKTAVSAATGSELKAGNCAEYANIAYTSLAENTTGQFVYRASMTKPYDHAFVITCPNDHGTDIDALYNDPDSMVVDGWWKGTVCSFKSFADGHNPYSKAVTKSNLKIRKRDASTGKPQIPPEVETALRESVGEVAKANPKLLTTLTKMALSNTTGVFGQSGHVWNRTDIEDSRSESEVFKGFDLALQKGGIGELEKEMEHILPEEFFGYISGDDKTLEAVLNSRKLAVYFQQNCDSITDEAFLKLCINMKDEQFDEYVSDDTNLRERFMKVAPILDTDSTGGPTGEVVDDDSDWEVREELEEAN